MKKGPFCSGKLGYSTHDSASNSGSQPESALAFSRANGLSSSLKSRRGVE